MGGGGGQEGLSKEHAEFEKEDVEEVEVGR